MNMDHEDILDQLTEAVIDAGQIILRNWDQPKNVYHKGKIDLVTQTDVEVEKSLKEKLQAILPEATFLAEETSNQKKLEDITWIIDPLDGTTNYTHSLQQVAISVALWKTDRIEMGIIYVPQTEEVFQGLAGKGAFLNQKSIAVSQESQLEQSLIATGFPYDIEEKIDLVLPPLRQVLLNCQDVRRMGAAAIDLAYVACGRFEGFYEMGLKPWDTAAGWLLVEEAGGQVSQFSPIQEYYLNSKTILATNKKIHYPLGQLLEQNS